VLLGLAEEEDTADDAVDDDDEFDDEEEEEEEDADEDDDDCEDGEVMKGAMSRPASGTPKWACSLAGRPPEDQSVRFTLSTSAGGSALHFVTMALKLSWPSRG
jgi:hypothetical protein